MQKSRFSGFSAKNIDKDPLGRLKTLKNGPRTFLEAPRPEPANLFRPRRPPRALRGRIFQASWQPAEAHWVPRWSPEASRRPPGGHLGHFQNNVGSILASFLVIFAAVLAPVLGPPRSSFSFAPCHVLIPFRWRARVRSLFSEGFEALSWKIGSPRSLKPWVAAGGREAIRILNLNGEKWPAVPEVGAGL